MAEDAEEEDGCGQSVWVGDQAVRGELALLGDGVGDEAEGGGAVGGGGCEVGAEGGKLVGGAGWWGRGGGLGRLSGWHDDCGGEIMGAVAGGKVDVGSEG